VARYDLDDDELVRYQTSVVPPSDLADFWGRTIAEARALAWEPKVEPVDCGLKVLDVFDVTFSGFGGEPIKAWLHVPARAEGDLSVVVRIPGYECGRGLPHQISQWPVAGYASLTIDARGQGRGGVGVHKVRSFDAGRSEPDGDGPGDAGPQVHILCGPSQSGSRTRHRRVLERSRLRHTSALP